MGWLPSAALAMDAPVTAVTVYSDRARVTRTAKLSLQGAQPTRIELPLLPARVNPSSIRVDVRSARGDDASVQRVEVAYVNASEAKLPTQEVEKLLAEFDAIDDQLATLQAEQSAYAAQLRLVGRVLPSASGLANSSPGQPLPPKLNPSGWSAVFGFTRQQYEKLQSKSRELSEKRRQLLRQRRTIVEKGQKLGGLLRQGGHRVTATLLGSGTASVELSYEVFGARWRPSYDLQLIPDKNRVELSLAGLVSQESGEDWTDARLTLSTAVPATATQIPKLLTWKLGERERFIPTPQPQREQVPPAPPVPPAPVSLAQDPMDSLRRKFSSKMSASTEAQQEGKDHKEEADRVRMSTMDDSDGSSSDDSPSPVPVPALAPPSEESVTSVVSESIQLGAPTSAPMPSRMSLQRNVSVAKPVVLTSVGLSPPPSYRPPAQSAALLASASGGYDMVFAAAAPDTVKSGQGERRVALLSRSFPVEVHRKILPALAPEAFLVADIKNQGTEPLPSAQAQLFVGADPAGVAQLGLMAPGEVISLPLGLDHAIRPARNVAVSTVEKGIISKDEVSEYTVTTEIVNPYRVPVQARISDQVPLVGDKNVEIKLLQTEPAAQFDEKTGVLEWRPQLAPGAKLVTKFVYSLRRPKGYRLGQAQY
jgi:hypothetical protein